MLCCLIWYALLVCGMQVGCIMSLAVLIRQWDDKCTTDRECVRYKMCVYVCVDVLYCGCVLLVVWKQCVVTNSVLNIRMISFKGLKDSVSYER